jgi:hypothetical protein
MQADRDWLRRAARAPASSGGPDRTRTAYFYNGLLPSVRLGVGRRRRRDVRTAERGAVVLRRPDPGRERRGPVVRGSRRRIGGGVAPLPCPPASAAAVDRAVARAVARADAAATNPDPREADSDRGQTPSRPPRPRRRRRRRRHRSRRAARDRRAARRRDPRCRGSARRADDPRPHPLDDPAGRAMGRHRPNGSGKTTLLSVVGIELWPTAGTVEVLGERYGRVDFARAAQADRHGRKRGRGVVPRRPHPGHAGDDRAARGHRTVVAHVRRRGRRAGPRAARGARPGTRRRPRLRHLSAASGAGPRSRVP